MLAASAFAAGRPENIPAIRLRDFQLTKQIVVLALRANIQIGKVDEAVKLLKILENLKDVKKNDTEDVQARTEISKIFFNLVSELDAQIYDLQRKKAQARLESSRKSFTEFLDGVVKDPGRKLSKKDLFSLARCYDTLDQHERAASLYAQYPVPEFLNVAKKGFNEAEERELQSYCYAQVMMAKQLRLAKKPAKAKEILDDLAAQKNVRQLLPIEREQIYLLEDAGLFGKAATRWEGFLKSPAFKGTDFLDDSHRVKMYYDGFYHRTLCYYKYSQSDGVKKAGKDGPYLAKAVDFIVRLEASGQEGWQMVGHRFRELMLIEPVLQEAYDKQKTGN